MAYIKLDSFNHMDGIVDKKEDLANNDNDRSLAPNGVAEPSANVIKCKEIIESFCVRYPNHRLEWISENLYVDAEVTPSQKDKLDSSYDPIPSKASMIGTIHTLVYTDVNKSGRKPHKNSVSYPPRSLLEG